jgi:hypothetical protein
MVFVDESNLVVYDGYLTLDKLHKIMSLYFYMDPKIGEPSVTVPSAEGQNTSIGGNPAGGVGEMPVVVQPENPVNPATSPFDQFAKQFGGSENTSPVVGTPGITDIKPNVPGEAPVVPSVLDTTSPIGETTAPVIEAAPAAEPEKTPKEKLMAEIDKLVEDYTTKLDKKEEIAV